MSESTVSAAEMDNEDLLDSLAWQLLDSNEGQQVQF
jgi:hypothetical protein